MKENRFRIEQEQRLQEMQRSHEPSDPWPRGCRGSRRPWLVLLGPSPGGKTGRDEEATPLWNQPFTDPLQWGRGFNKSMRPILDVLIEGATETEASLLYAVFNFDSVQNSKAINVPQERMIKGAEEVVKLLEAHPPRLIVPMEWRSFNTLRTLLPCPTYDFCSDFEFPISLPIYGNPNRLHRKLFGFKISGSGPLSGAVVVKLPQHPARIFCSSYAEDCAREVRELFMKLV